MGVFLYVFATLLPRGKEFPFYRIFDTNFQPWAFKRVLEHVYVKVFGSVPIFLHRRFLFCLLGSYYSRYYNKEMSYIPLDLLSEMLSKRWYLMCCITGKTPVQLHHAVLFANKSLQKAWAIIPLHKSIHDMVTPHNPAYSREMEERVLLIALNRATDKELEEISKVENWKNKRDILREKYGH